MPEPGTMKGALVLKEAQTPKGVYGYGSQTGGEMALVLPYRKSWESSSICSGVSSSPAGTAIWTPAAWRSWVPGKSWKPCWRRR